MGNYFAEIQMHNIKLQTKQQHEAHTANLIMLTFAIHGFLRLTMNMRVYYTQTQLQGKE